MTNQKYGIIGNGRMAKHLRYYFSLLNIPCVQWSRSQSEEELQQLIHNSTHILVLISDDAIIPFIDAHPELATKTLVHFSGSLVTDKALGVHPLMTFSNELYDLNTYASFPFVCEEGVDFNMLFPALQNPYFSVKKEHKAYYHSLCVMCGNFTTILWSEIFESFKNKLGMPKEILFPFMVQIFKNLQRNHKTALTGPVSRKDKKTIVSNLEALSRSPYQDLYYGFLNFTEKTQRIEKPSSKKTKSIFS